MSFAGLIHLETQCARSPLRDVYVFDPHRLALPAWALMLESQPKPALLVTLDRHLDLVAPKHAPPPGLTPKELDAWARDNCDPRNFDHVLTAMAAGLIGDAIVIARTRMPEVAKADTWTDPHGREHRWVVVPTVAGVADDFGTPRASPEGKAAARLLEAHASSILDVDLDCFTTTSDADPTETVPWPRGLIRQHVLPRDSGAFWSAVLSKCRGFTFAREPSHCGGLLAAGRLFEDAAHVLFEELLEAEVP